MSRTVALIVTGLAPLAMAACESGPTGCKLSLQQREIDGVRVSLQDQGGPGRDDCDLDLGDVQGPAPVLTYECKLLYPPSYSGPRPTAPSGSDCGQ